jgi:hypothetical protein
MKKLTILYLSFAILGVLSACDRTEEPIYEKLSDEHYPVIVQNTNFFTPAVPSAGYVKGTAIKIEFDYFVREPINEIQFWEKIGTADSVALFKGAAVPAFSQIKNCDTLIYNYTVPSAPASGTTIAIRGRVVNKNGLAKDRVLTYRIR